MLHYTCAKCNRELRCLKNDIILVHFIDSNRDNEIDVIRYGDLYECPECGCQVVCGLGSHQFFGNTIDNQKEWLESNKERIIEVKRLP